MHKGHSSDRPAWLALSSLSSGLHVHEGGGGGDASGVIWRVTHGRWAGLPYHNASVGTAAGDKSPFNFPSAAWISDAARTGGSSAHLNSDGLLEGLSRHVNGGETLTQWRDRRAIYGSSFVRTSSNTAQRFETMPADPTAAQTAFYCVKYRCNRNDDCSGRGDPLATAGGSSVAYWPDCGVCVCDEGYSGARCETFVDSFDILTQHRARWPVTYGEAAAACEAAGEALAPLRSEAQWGKLMFGTGPMLSADQSCWLGARAAAGGGIWRWHPSRHSRLSGAVLSNERVLAFRMFAPWSPTDYSLAGPRERRAEPPAPAPVAAASIC